MSGRNTIYQHTFEKTKRPKMNLITEVMIGFAIGGGLGFGAVFGRVVLNSKRHRFRDNMLFISEAKRILSKATRQTNAANAILLGAHNQGGQILAGTKLFSSVIAESPEDESISVYKNWQEIAIDSNYQQTLERLSIAKHLFLTTDSMPESLLKRTYENIGIIGSVVFEVYHRTKRSYYYVSFPCKKNLLELIDSKDFVKLEYTVNALRNLCKQNDKRGILK